MKHLILAVTVSVVVCTVQSCANNKPVEKKVEEPKEKVDKLVARVSSVNRRGEYVLIQRYGRLIIPEDSILYGLSSKPVIRAGEGSEGTRADGAEKEQASSLKLTGEKLGQFLAADIVSGNPKVGDAVYLRDLEDNTASKPIQKLTPNQANLNKLLKETRENLEQKPRVIVNDSLNSNVENVIDEVPLAPPSDDDTLLPLVE